MPVLDFIAQAVGFLASIVASWQAFRASRLYLRAHGLTQRAEVADRGQLRELMARAAERARLDAEWQPVDHRWLVTSLVLLVTSFGVSTFSFLLGLV